MLYANQYKPPRGLGFECAKAWFRTGHGAVEKTVGITWEKETEDIFSLTSLSLTLWAPTRSNAYRTKAVGAERRAREKDCR